MMGIALERELLLEQTSSIDGITIRATVINKHLYVECAGRILKFSGADLSNPIDGEYLPMRDKTLAVAKIMDQLFFV